MAEAQAGAASASGADPHVAAGEFAGHALDLLADGEYGVRFTSEYEPGGDYPAMPPPPAEIQHQMGLHEGAEGGEQ